MTLVEDIKTAPKLSFAALMIAFLGGVFLLTGLAAPYWLTNVFPAGGGGTTPQTFTISPQPLSVAVGLWEYCDVYPSAERICLGLPTMWGTVLLQGLCTVALLFAGGVGLLVLFYVIFPSQRRPMVALLAVIGCGVSVLLDVAALVLFVIGVDVGIQSISFQADTSNLRLGWAFALTCTGTAHYFLVGVISLVLCLKRSPEVPSMRLM